MATTGIRLIDTAVDLRVDGDDATAAGVREDVVAFLGSHATPRSGGPADLTLVLTSSPGEEPQCPGEDVFLRRSSSDFFTSPAVRRRVGGVEHLHCPRSGLRLRLNPPDDEGQRVVGAHVTPASVLDVVEVVRDLVLKLEENKGALPLHATAAVRDGRVVLVAGAKGAGKSTVLLELVERHGWAVLAGDRSLLVARAGDTEPLVAGWPDYPHLGLATIARYQGLPTIAGLAEGFTPPPDRAFSPLGKLPLDPAAFRCRFATAEPGLRSPGAAVLYPSIGPGPTTLTPVAPAQRRALIADTVESAFDADPWTASVADQREPHRAVRERLLDAVARAPAWTLTGEGDLAVDVPL